jgi:hypothetical protein
MRWRIVPGVEVESQSALAAFDEATAIGLSPDERLHDFNYFVHLHENVVAQSESSFNLRPLPVGFDFHGEVLDCDGEVPGRTFERAFIFVDVHARDPMARLRRIRGVNRVRT